MTTKTILALRITPDSLRVAMTAVPDIGEMHINEVLGGYLVLNVPHLNKDGSISKRAPQKFVLLNPERFNERFFFTEKRQARAFVPVALL